MSDEAKPLIEVARERTQEWLRDLADGDAMFAHGLVVGYDDGRESVFAEMNADRHQWLNEAQRALEKALAEGKAKDARIAELERFIAAQDAHDHYAERDEVKAMRAKIAELEAHLAAHEAKRFHSGKQVLGEYAARQVQGVVVDDEMRKAARDAWIGSPNGCDVISRVLTAALSSAKIVPLASAKAACWMSKNKTRSASTPVLPVPCYPGIAESPNAHD